MSPKLNWLRWLAVLPAAIAAYLIGNAIFILIFSWWVQQGFIFTNFFDWLTKPLSAVVAALAYTGIGAIVAPMYKKQTVLILIIIFALVTGFVLYPNLINKNYEDVWIAVLEVAIMTINFFSIKDEYLEPQ